MVSFQVRYMHHRLDFCIGLQRLGHLKSYRTYFDACTWLQHHVHELGIIQFIKAATLRTITNMKIFFDASYMLNVKFHLNAQE